MTRTKRLLLATGVALTLAVPVGTGAVEAAPAETTTVTIRDGDSLAGLAWRHDVSLSALLRANSLTLTSVIHPGDTIVIPAGGTAAPSAGPSAGPSTSTRSAAPTAGSTYEVAPGDALAGIAWRQGVSLGALLSANGLSIASVIHPGQILSLPPTTRPIPTTTNTTNTTMASSRSVTPAAGSTYEVAPGDALAGIAWRQGVSLGALLSANGLSIASVIHPGQVLSLPAPTRPIPATSTSAATTTSRSVAPTPRASTTQPGSSSIETIMAFLRAQVGADYRFFSAGPDAYDCSGLVVAAFRQVGVALPHQSQALATRGTAVDWATESIIAGDLVFTSAFNDPERITHVGIALDSGRWVHAVGPGRGVRGGFLPSSDRIMEVRRISLP